MKHSVYILRSHKDGKRYIGMTSNLSYRLCNHKEGLVESTRNRRPLELINVEEFETKEEARAREKYFKSGLGREFLKRNNIS